MSADTPPFPALWERIANSLARQGIENLVWYDPAKPIPAATIDAIKKIFDNVPRADVVLPKLTEGRAALLKSVQWNCPSTGLLVKDAAGAGRSVQVRVCQCLKLRG